MPTNYFIFSTDGTWDQTTLFNNGEEFPADQLFLELKAGRDMYGNPTKGGITDGGDMTAYVAPQGGSGQYGIFPGRIDLEFPIHKVTIANQTPNFLLEFTQISLDGQDISNQVVDFFVNIDSVENQVQAYLVMYKSHLLAADEVATINFLS